MTSILSNSCLRPPCGPVNFNRSSSQTRGLYYWWSTNSPGFMLPEFVRGGNGTISNATYDSFTKDGGFSILGSSSASITFTTVTLSTYTFSCWFYGMGTAASQAIIGNNFPSGASIGINSDGTFRIVAGNLDIPSDSGSYSLNTWNLLTLVKDGSSALTLYVNGINNATFTPSSNSAIFDSLFTNASSEFYNDYAYDFRLYEVALTDSEVWNLYNPSTRWELYNTIQKTYYLPSFYDSYTELDVMIDGTKRDAESLTVASNTVQRFRAELVGASAAEIAKVSNSPPAITDYGLAVRPIYSASVGSTKRQSNVTTSASAITSVDIPAVHGVQIIAAKDNTNKIYVGTSTVTADSADSTDGYPLAAGETVLMPTNNAINIYAISASGTQKLFFLVL